MAKPIESRRTLAVIMFTDVVGFTALTERDEALSLDLLDEHRRVLRSWFAACDGTEVKTMGDGFLVTFDSACDAVRCAVEIQRSLEERNRRTIAHRRLWVRIGLHADDVVRQGSDVLGHGVNVAARVEPLAPPGGICLTQQVLDHLGGRIGLPAVRLKSAAIQNVQSEVRVFRLGLPWEPRPWWLRGRELLTNTPRARVTVVSIMTAAIFFLAFMAASRLPPARSPVPLASTSPATQVAVASADSRVPAFGLASQDLIRLESFGADGAVFVLSVSPDGQVELPAASSIEGGALWEISGLRFDPSKPALLVARLRSVGAGGPDGWLAASYDGKAILSRDSAGPGTQWALLKDPSYEKTGIVYLRHGAEGGRHAWLEAGESGGRAVISTGSGPGPRGIWRLTKISWKD